MWSIYRRPVEHYEEVDDRPEPVRIDPVARVFRLVLIFAIIQALNLAATLCLWLR